MNNMGCLWTRPLSTKHKMADRISTLAELCIKSVANTADLWDPLVLTELPKSMVIQIAEALHPLDLEKCENTQLFKKLGINTEHIWRSLYYNKWNHLKVMPYCWLPVSELTARMAEVVWREQYWYILFSQVLGEAACGGLCQQDYWIWKKCLSSNHTSNKFFLKARSFSFEDFILLNRKYAKCLHLNQKVIALLIENKNILELFEEYVEYVKLNFVTETVINDLSKLLSSLLTRNLKGIGMYFCKFKCQQSWEKIFAIKKQDSSSGCEEVVSKCLAQNVYESNQEDDLLRHLSDDTDSQFLDAVNSYKTSFSSEGELGSTGFLMDDDKVIFNECSENASEGTEELLKVDIYNFASEESGSMHTLASHSPSQNESLVMESLYEEIYTGTFQSASKVQAETPGVQYLLKPSKNLAFSSLQHLLLEDTSNFLENKFFTEGLRFWTNLQSLTIGKWSSEDNMQEKLSQLSSSIVEIVLTGNLRHLAVSFVNKNFIQYLTSVVGSKCLRCSDSGGMLNSLQIAYNPFSDRNVLADIAQLLINQCCCSGKQKEIGKPSFTKNLIDKKTSDDVEVNPQICDANKFYGLQELVLDGLDKNYGQLYGSQSCNNGAVNMARSLSHNSTLVFVKLSGCSLNTEGISAIFHSIAGTNGYRGNMSLKILDLSYNSYKPDQDDGLEMVLKFSTLIELQLANCSLTILPDNVIEALSQNKTLKVLNLSRNELGDNGVVAFSKIFKNTTQHLALKRINLSANRITIASVKVFVSSLFTWLPCRLEELDLRDNLLLSCGVNGANSDKESSAFDTVVPLLKSLVKTLFNNDLNQSSQFGFFDYISEM